MGRPIGEMVREFHEAIGVEPTIELNADLIDEEWHELVAASDGLTGDHDKMLKEAADLVYVTVGWIQAFGADPDAILEAVHTNNMGKRSAGQRNLDTGKWEKPADYPVPNLRCACGELLHFGQCASTPDDSGRERLHRDGAYYQGRD